MSEVILQSITLSAVLGAVGLLLGRRLRVPSLLFFLIFGIIAGPTFFNVIQPTKLGLTSIVEIGVAIIIFEGGLSLRISGLKSAPVAIRRTLLFVLPLTGIVAALLVRNIASLPWQVAVLFGTIIFVTGPTVIGPILRNIPLKPQIENLLRWEAIWSDCASAVLAGVVLEWVLSPDIGGTGLVLSFFYRLGVGVAVGVALGFMLSRYLLPWTVRLGDPALPGIVALTSAVGVFYLSNELATSSGVVAAAASGITLAGSDMPEIEDIRHFKDQLTTILVAFLFVLLSAHLDIVAVNVKWVPIITVVLLLTFVVRPLVVAISLWGTSLKLPERLYIGFIGPRGIIAAALASYFGIALRKANQAQATDAFIMLTFLTIFVSGAFSTFAAKPLSRLFDAAINEFKTGIIIVGYSRFSHEFALILKQYVPVVIVDSDPFKCAWAAQEHFRTYCRSALSDNLYEELLEEGFRRAVILTPNAALNNLIAQKAQVHLGRTRVFTAIDAYDEQEGKLKKMAGKGLAFSRVGFNVSEAAMLLEKGKAHLMILDVDELANREDAIPLAYEYRDGIRIVRAGEEVRGRAVCFVKCESSSDK